MLDGVTRETNASFYTSVQVCSGGEFIQKADDTRSIVAAEGYNRGRRSAKHRVRVKSVSI